MSGGLLMRNNNHNTRHKPVDPPAHQRGPFKGFLSRGSGLGQRQQQQQRSKPADDLEITHSPRRRPERQEFLPNPKIPVSPSGTPPKKTWEGAYRNFLSLGKSNSPHGSDLSKSPDTKMSDLSTSLDTKKSAFSLVPGSKRILVQAPQTVPTHRHTAEVITEGMPTIPAICTGPVLTNQSGFKATLESSRVQSMTDLDLQNDHLDSSGLRGRLFKGVFNRSCSDGQGALFRNRSTHNMNADDLDHVMRKGVNKNSPEYTHVERKQAPPPSFAMQNQTSSQEDIPSGLDALLAGSSSSPHFTVEVTSIPRIASYAGSYGSGNVLMHPMGVGEAPEHVPAYSYYLPQRPSSGSLGPHQTGLNIEDDSASSGSDGFPLRARPQHQQMAVAAGGAGLGSLLSQQVAAHTDSNYLQQQPQPYSSQHHYQQHPHCVHMPPPPPPSGVAASLNRSGTTPNPVSNLEAMLQDPAFTVGSSPSSTIYQQQQSPSITNHVDPEMKKAFTKFHNQARFARDSTSPFLNGGDEFTPSSIPHDSYVSYHMTMMGGGGTSVPHAALSEREVRSMGNISTSLPLDTVDEHNISINKGLCLLKPVQGTESWEPGRRYLIAPAALAACPLTVINRLAGGLVQSASEAASEASSAQAFGSIDLGECLITYIGEKHHLSLGKWASCRLVLRQNFLVEFDASAAITGLPRGYVHLQHAVTYPHRDFPDVLELDFYASPCAKTDRRVLMIRVRNREERDDWVTCLNEAARLRVEDLWEYDSNIEFGRGRYAAVFPARRKNEKYYATRSESPDNDAALKKYDCALKIVDKSEFWRRVVKGRERADTLVREPSVQATLTAKCGKIPTFLQLRGFFETSDSVVMELELLKGTDLFQYVSSKGVLGEYEAAIILRDMLTSLDAMNRVGLAHRDIKPANVLMCDREEDGVSVKVGDFGMSTFVGVDGLVRGRCGTPGYVAPEILTVGSGAGYSSKVDVFSAGVTLYVMLCGYEPFYGENEKALIEANRRAVIDFPTNDWDAISKESRDLVRKMTSVDPQERLSAKEALEHPWITRMCDEQHTKPVDVNIALAFADAPAEGACNIS